MYLTNLGALIPVTLERTGRWFIFNQLQKLHCEFCGHSKIFQGRRLNASKSSNSSVKCLIFQQEHALTR